LSYPTVREYSRHYRDSYPVNDHQSDLDIRDDPCVFPRRILSLPQMSMSYSLCFCDTCNIRDLIVGISIPSSISLPTLLFTRSRDILSPRPSHMLQHWMNLTEWAQSIFHHADEQIPLLMHTPQPTHWKTKRHLINHPVTL
jgi:hypothetical protein